jgi:hypothetical protein
MTLHPPRPQSTNAREDALDYEIAQEQAAALGRLGRAFEGALATLASYDQARAERGEEAAPAIRARLVQEASDALWCFVIQREACGLRDQRLLARDYRIPREVLNRMGVFGGGSRSTSV